MPPWILDVIVSAAFVLQVYNLRELGKGNIRYLLMIVIYSLFAIAEAWVAIFDSRISYWLFVSLSLYGASQGVKGYVRERENIFIKRTKQSGGL